MEKEKWGGRIKGREVKSKIYSFAWQSIEALNIALLFPKSLWAYCVIGSNLENEDFHISSLDCII